MINFILGTDSVRLRLISNKKLFTLEFVSEANNTFYYKKVWKRQGDQDCDQLMHATLQHLHGVPNPVLDTFCAMVSINEGTLIRDITFKSL